LPEIVTNFLELHICRRTDEGDKFLLLKRSEQNKLLPGIWQMVTGTIEPNESTKQALVRELEEETGIINSELYSIGRVNTFYLSKQDKICISPVFLSITETEAVKLSEEHSEYKWVCYEEACELIYWQNQIESLESIMKFLNDDALFKKLVKI
jgi:dATP pyrophosphohydrolase